MKSVLLSLQPYWVFLIIAKAMGWNIEKEKTVEVRKNYPKADNWNKIVKIYCSKNKKSFARIPKEYQPLMQQFLGKVIGEFVCDNIAIHTASCLVVKEDSEKATAGSCLSAKEIRDYLRGNKATYNLYDLPDFCCWHILELIVYDKPKELSEFQKYGALNYDDWLYGMYNGSSESSYEKYLIPFRMSRPPQSWCYVEVSR